MKTLFKYLILFALVLHMMLLTSLKLHPFSNHYSYENFKVSDNNTTILNIGSRLELFIDDYLIDHLYGNAELRLHHPEPKEIVISHDKHWEGKTGYYSIFKDDDIYRMYYYARPKSGSGFFCYCESLDGIHWIRPELGLHEFNGSKKNNIILAPGKIGDNSIIEFDSDAVLHTTVFKDENPNSLPDEKYKAFSAFKSGGGLFALKSPDGIHWSLMSDKPVINSGSFDSQNTAFWDATHNVYRAYYRYFTEGETPMPYSPKTWKPLGNRAIRTAISKDFLNWNEPTNLSYVNSPPEQLYTNVVKPYHRAPHILIGIPVRYSELGWSDSMYALPEREQRELRAKASEGEGYTQKGRLGTAITEALFMTSRNGVKFNRWNEAFIRPGIEREGTWKYGGQYVAWSVVETKTAFEGEINELSFYAPDRSWTNPVTALRRYSLRIDGFVSVNAPMSGGEIITKPFIFKGNKLVLNFSSSSVGGIWIEIQDEAGKPIPGFTIEDCSTVFGDTIERMVKWKNNKNLSLLEGTPVRLRIVLKDADLFSFQFK